MKIEMMEKITRILTNGNENVVESSNEIIRDIKQFYSNNEEWFSKLLFDEDEIEDAVVSIYAYWLIGYELEAKYQYGVSCDLTSYAEGIVENLEDVFKNLRYEVDFSNIEFEDDIDVQDALVQIDEYMEKEGYRLVALDTDSDSYNLFVAKSNEYDELLELGKEAGIVFQSKFN